MSYHETQYPDLMGGVSQKTPSERAANRLTAQVNMYNDPVRGLCRRPPVEFVDRFITSEEIPPTGEFDRKWFRSRFAGREVVVEVLAAPDDQGTFNIYDAETGELWAHTDISFDEFSDEDRRPPGSVRSYLAHSSLDSIKITSLDDQIFILNTEQTPVLDTGFLINITDPSLAGYFEVVRGEFNTEYSITLHKGGGAELTASYATPDGTSAGDAEKATAGYIAGALFNQIYGKVTVDGEPGWEDLDYWIFPTDGTGFLTAGHRVWGFREPSGLRVSTRVSSDLIRVSDNLRLRETSELPRKLPQEFAGYPLGVGAADQLQYFRYNRSRETWEESAAFEAQERVNNIAVRVRLSSTGYVSSSILRSQLRPAGDRDSNPTFRFAEGISGIGSYKGRLVLLAGDYVCASGTAGVDVWYRATMSDVLDSDPIEIAQTSSRATPYTYATSFGGGLLLTSAQHQAIIPGDIPFTPQTATLRTVSAFSQRDNVEPLLFGNSVLLPYSRPGKVDQDGLYLAALQDALQPVLDASDLAREVPAYLGKVNFLAAATSSSAVVLGDHTHRLTVMQVLELSEEGRQTVAWHEWRVPVGARIHFCYFLNNRLYVVLGAELSSPEDGQIYGYYLCQLNMTPGIKPDYYLDYGLRRPVAGTFATDVPDNYDSLLVGSDFSWYALGGEFEGLGGLATAEPLGVADGEPRGGEHAFGIRYESSVEPTPPIIRDRSEYALRRERVTLVRFRGHLEESGQVKATVTSRVHSFEVPDLTPLGVYMPGQIGQGPLHSSGEIVVPCRTDAKETQLRLDNDGFYDMNLKALEYGFKVQPKHRRA